MPISLLAELRAETPLDPPPDDARSDLQRELIKPEYNDQNPIERVLDALDEALADGVESAGNVGVVPTLATMVVAVLLLVAVVLLVRRFRGTEQAAKESAAVLTDEIVTATELRTRAEAALAEGRFGEAVVDGFRALAVRQVERGRLPDSPGLTALEVARALADLRPEQAHDLFTGADLFDAVLYGDREASEAQARTVLELDDALVAVR